MSDLNVFKNLKEDQYNELKDAILLVTILIAGADGKIDAQELNWAEKLTKIRTYANPEELNKFYGEIEKSFSADIQQLINELPKETQERQTAISARLAKLNNILPLLENKVAYQIYESLTSFSKHIAKSSGGFLRFASISTAEKKWVKLPMINPVILAEEDEDDE